MYKLFIFLLLIHLAIGDEDVFQSVSVDVTGPTVVRVAWKVFPELQPELMNVIMWATLVGLGDCNNQSEPAVKMGTSTSHDGNLDLQNLDSWHRYNVTVKGSNQNNYYSQMISSEVITLENSAPTGSVTKLSLVSVRSHRAVISWGLPECQNRAGGLSTYEVRVSTDSKSVNTTWGFNTSDTQCTVTDLSPNATYSVRVAYVNSIGRGPFSQINFTTPNYVLTGIEISTMAVTYSTVTLTLEPSPFNINSYKVAYGEFQDFTKAAVTNFTNVTEASVTLSQLKPDTVYFMKVAVLDDGDVGPYGSAYQVKTLQLINLNLISRTTNCFFLTWMLPTDVLRLVTAYTLTVASVTDGQRLKFNLDQDIYLKAVCELRPSTSYSVTVLARNSDLVISMAIANYTTNNVMPSQPPTATLVRCTNTTVTVALEPLVAMDTPVKSYQLLVGRITNQNGTSLNYITALFNSSFLVRKTEFVIGNGQSVGGYVNKALVPNSFYSIVFTAQFDFENETTPNVSHLQVFTETFDPGTAKLTTLTLAYKNTTCMNVTWSVPAQHHNTISGLQLSYAQADGKVTSTLHNVTLLQTYKALCGLAPSTTYNFTLSVITRNGVLVTVIRSFSTVPQTPPSPASPILVNSSFTNITIIIGPVRLDDTRSTTEYVIVVDEVLDPAGGDTRTVRGNVTARLQMRQLPSNVYFIVGNGIVYGGYRNSPLRPYGYYVIYYGACSTFSNYTKCSYSTTRAAVRAIPHLFTVSSPEEDDNLVGVVLGCVVAALLVFVVIALVVYFRRRMGALAVFVYLRHGKGSDVSVGYKCESGDVKPDQVTLEDEKEDYNLEECWSSIHDYRQCRHIISGKRSADSVIFEEHGIASISSDGAKSLSFADEFQHLRLKPAAASEKIARQFPGLNRSSRLLPYDHSLVKLKPDVSADRTYVNASFIPGYRKTPAYIAAQSPFNDTTVLDFWRLIFQRRIKTVVMMTNTQEMGVTKCLQYWPSGQTSQVGHFHLRVTQTTERNVYSAVHVELAAGQSESPRTVSIFQMTSWPKCGVPDDPLPLLEMRRLAKRWQGEDKAPILVHCSTGVGRTGVFIAIDALIEQYEAEGSVLVFDFIRAIRKDRPCMVRTFSQYVFIYEALFQYFLARDMKTEDVGRGQELSSASDNSTITCHGDLREQFASMERFNRRSVVGCTHRLMGIKYSYTFNDDGGGSPVLTSQEADLSESLSDLNQNLDQVKSVSEPVTTPLTLDCSLCASNLQFKTVCGDLRRSKYLILDSSACKSTGDIIQIVIENDITTVVSLCDHSLYQGGGAVHLGQGRTLQLTSQTLRTGFTFTDLNICLNEEGYVTSKCVRAFHNIRLPNERTSSSADLIAGLLADVFDWQKCDAVSGNNILVHGQNDSVRPELLVMLSIICQKMSELQEVDVYSSVKFYNRRQQLVQDHGDYEFCFQVLRSFIACHNDSTI